MATVVKALRAWHRQLQHLRVDLVGDYAGRELFMVEGDSLLLLAFGDSRIDMDGGFQLLHAVYVVESFLANLKKRGCSFHLVFFDENSCHCIPPGLTPEKNGYKYLFARSAIVRHLTLVAESGAGADGSFRIFQFTSPDHDKFQKYLAETRPYFIMCHDGVGNVTNKFNAGQLLLLKGFMWRVLAAGYSVALIDRIEFRDSKVETAIVQGRPRIHFRKGRLEFFLQAIRNRLNVNFSLFLENDYVFPEIPTGAVLSERELLTVISISAILSSTNALEVEPTYMAIFVLHIALLNNVSLPQRSLDLSQDPLKEISDKQIALIITLSHHFINDVRYRQVAAPLEANIHDYIDGRLLRGLKAQLYYGTIKLESLSKAVLDDFTRLANVIEKISGCPITLPDQIKSDPGDTVTVTISQHISDHARALAVLPFSNPTFDPFLSRIKLTTDSSMAALEVDKRNKLFHEVTHWHSRKPLEATFSGKQFPQWKRSSNKWAAGRARKAEQFKFARMQKYAASLVGAQGKVLEPIVITKDLKLQQATTKEALDQAKKKGKAANKPASKKDLIRAENSKRVADKEDQMLRRMWQEQCRIIEGIVSESAKIILLDQFLAKIKSTLSVKSCVIECEVRLYKVWMLQRIWAGFCREDTRDNGYQVAAMIFDEAKKMLASKGLTKKAHEILINLFKSLGIAMPQRKYPSDPTLDGKPPLGTSWDGSALGDIELHMTSTEFQLMHCGIYMDRNMDSKPDPRVPFEPDGWQRKVLDEIDKNNSVFVVAPTSAGKTFISFYAMEKVLRSSDEGVLVYVAPNKALVTNTSITTKQDLLKVVVQVNQVAAEIMARFRKTYTHAGKSVWAMHTRDERIGNHTGCQILVTVPHILQIMLLSPSNANSWSTRVKRIIFDEIHCIGQAEDGVVWEQLLLLAPCPIIALSATVGNPEEFSSWMRSTQEPLGIKLEMIQHHHRYSDLRKMFYKPPEGYRFTELSVEPGFPRLEGSPSFIPMHPIASLIDSSRGIPDDLALEPRDCLSLYRTMIKQSTKEYSLKPSLDPEVFFAKSPVIHKMDVIKWEAKLKDELRPWMESPGSPFDDVVHQLMGNFASLGKAEMRPSEIASEEQISKRSFEEAMETASDLGTLLKTTISLLDELNSKNALPAILFSYDRSICDDLCFYIVRELQETEKAWREQDPEWNKLIRAWKEHQEMKSSRAAKKQAKGAAGNSQGSKEEQMRDKATEGSKFFDTFNPNHPLPQFSFADKSKCGLEEFQELIKPLRELDKFPAFMVLALRRGIGIHHSGVNAKYRHVVEMLFRKGYLRVVIATGTLALGINMPCKTTVFVGDSVWLTALNFRQAAGRAGRRGFDNMGNVIFLGVPLSKARRLMSSRLPSLIGHFPITTSLVLRLFSLLHDSQGSEHAKRAITGLLSQPRLYLGGDSFKEQVLHHLRFSIEYLRRQSLLGPGGEPLNFAGLTGHLYYTENSSFAFHALLRSGIFHSMCARVATKPQKTCMTLMLVMAHLFGRRPCKRTDPVNKLPALPREAAKVLGKHNCETLQIYTTYVKTFAAEHCMDKPDNMLPFSYSVCGKEAVSGNPQIIPLTPVIARSSFVALSGLGDNFSSISDLTDSVRAGIFLEKAAVPYLSTDEDIPLNSYLLDFYRHGEFETLTRDNKIRRSERWFLINDFSLILATIVTSLANFIDCVGDDDSLDVVGIGDIAELDMEDSDQISRPTDGDEESDLGESSEEESDVNWMMDEAGLVNVLRAFELLKANLDEKFKANWA